MKPKWCIEDSFAEDMTPLLEAVKRQGFAYVLVPAFDADKCLAAFPGEDCVIFCGCLNSAQYLRRKAKWIPGVYYNVKQYECVNYYGLLGKYLFNGNYIILPYGDLLRQKEFLYEKVGADRTVFIRPSRGDKTFTGGLVFKEHFDQRVERMAFGQMGHAELVVVAEPRNIQFEWRFVIVDGKVITGSQYKEGYTVASHASYPTGAFDLAAKVATVFNPEPVWVCDVCQTVSDDYKVMEVGCFSCAGLYQCDRDKIVEAVSAAALREWESYRDPSITEEIRPS